MITRDALKTVSTTQEVIHGVWLYQVIQDHRGCFVKRVPLASPLWGHGVLVQLIDNETRRFLPANCVGLPAVYFPDLDAALSFIDQYQD